MDNRKLSQLKNWVQLDLVERPIKSEIDLCLFSSQWYLKNYQILKKQITSQIACQIYDHVRNDMV